MTRTDVTLAKRLRGRRADRHPELEADALRYPDERDEILLEAAEAWGRVGNQALAKEPGLTELHGQPLSAPHTVRSAPTSNTMHEPYSVTDEPCDGSSL